jgi:hypothetical protein
MGHARYSDLRDLDDVLEAIRELPGISEPTPGIFYLRRVPFLHFHTKDRARWADAKVGLVWGPEIQIPLGCGRREKTIFLREVRARHAACSATQSDAGVAVVPSNPRLERTDLPRKKRTRS